MSIPRTRIARLTAISAVVVSLGALTAGPAAAQSGVDVPSRPASVDWVAVEDPSSVTFSRKDDANSTTAVTFAQDDGADATSIDTKAAEDASSVTFSSEDDANSTTAVASDWRYIDRYFWGSDCARAGMAGMNARAWVRYECRYGSAFSYYELWVSRT